MFVRIAEKNMMVLTDLEDFVQIIAGVAIMVKRENIYTVQMPMNLENAAFIDSQLNTELGNANIVMIIQSLRHAKKCTSICIKCMMIGLVIYGIRV